jgi:hypothetical protein
LNTHFKINFKSTRFAMILVLLLAACLLSVAAQDRRNIGGTGITLFEDLDYGGRVVTLQRDTPDLRDYQFNDLATSIRVGRGERWEVCEDINYGGQCIIISGNERDLRDRGWNDMISSVRRVRGNRPEPPYGGGNRDYITLYSQANYSGAAQNYDSVQTDINTIARSITVGRGTWQVCTGRNFTGRCQTLTNSVSNTNSMGLGRMIRSLRPMGIVGPGPFPGPRPDRNWYVTLYDQQNYRGIGTTYRGEQPSVDKRTRSIVVNGGVWDVCDQPNFTGRCQTININVPNFNIYSIGDRIRSLRPQSPR